MCNDSIMDVMKIGMAIIAIVCVIASGTLVITIVALVFVRNKHKERMAEINLAILRTPIEQL